MIRRVVAGVGAMAVLVVALALAPAEATAYRFWSYWTGGSQWTYSSKGPAFRVPPGDSVEGWHFVVSPDGGSASTPPSAASAYHALCPGQPAAPSGQKRVAVVIDFGPAGIAPSGESPPAEIIECVSAPEGANGLQVLQQVVKLRFHTSGLICGIAGYPATECPGDRAAPADRKTTSPPQSAIPAATPTAPAQVPAPPADDAGSGDSPSPTSEGSASPSTTAAAGTPSQAVPVEIPVASDSPATADAQIPPWLAAVGAAMIAVLLALAYLVRRGRQ